MSKPKVTIYTDGGASPNPGLGGWGALLIYGKNEKELYGGEKESTNNRMELTAAIKALEALKKPCEIQFYTDSQYVRKGITEWIPGWKKRNWKRKGGALKNVDLWKALDKLNQKHDIEWHWVKGHSGDVNNERVDQLVHQARAELK